MPPSLKMRNLSPILTRLLLAVLALAAPVQAQDGVATDRAALEALYHATDGPNWQTSTNWLSGEPLSTWHGVLLTTPSGRVRVLSLPANRLHGAIPAEIANLTELELLNLTNNALEGVLPTGLMNLTRLDTLWTGQVDLCAPRDPAFEAWLETIDFGGMLCPPQEQSVIDVAVFYTPAARDFAGGGAAEIESLIDSMVAETNLAYAASGVNQTLSLVAVREVAHTEADAPTDQERLVDKSDGVLDGVHAIRDEGAADVVMLLGDYDWGFADVMVQVSPDFEDRALGVASVSDVRWFAHELGHLMGLRHDRHLECHEGHCSPAAFEDGYGYVNQEAFEAGAPDSAGWYTIMAYGAQCVANGLDCEPVLRFSNPDRLWPPGDGEAMGIPGVEHTGAVRGPANAVRTLNRTRTTVANFRTPTTVTLTDKAALEALYNATNGPSWTDNTHWTSDAPLSSWYGVTTNSDGRVTRLELDDNGLRGKLPAALGDLSELERLNLEDNALRGTLPSALANLTNLTSLRLTRSRALTGPLPDGLRELTDLSTVQIQDTELCAPDNDTFQAWWETISKTGLICPPTAQSVIEVAVFYTPAARSQAGGTAQMKARIDHMVAATNTAYRDGGVNQRIQAVAVEEVAYTEGTSDTDLGRLHDPGDGYMDEVHDVRDRLGADIVLLIRRANAGTVSRAYLMTPVSLGHASFAFGVVANIGGARHFAHELGHIMGLNHDRFVSCESGSCEPAAFPYAYGYVNQPGLRPGASSSKPWLTIMAYTNQCTGNGVACQQLMRFSDPDQTYQGDPLGIAGLAPSNSWANGPSDAVRALNRTRGYVANFRQPPPDITVSFGAEAYEATEDGTGANVRLELSAPPTRPIDIPLTLTATGATAYDYTGVPAAVHFDADDTARTFTVRARDDAADDDGETVTLTLGAPLPAKVTAVSPSQTTVTLTDNDPDPGGAEHPQRGTDLGPEVGRSLHDRRRDRGQRALQQDRHRDGRAATQADHGDRNTGCHVSGQRGRGGAVRLHGGRGR